ncbi:DsbE family thiol:disulfide interchange protein [Modicisalibacter radicis]|uniref:DsbE family thiol:disulfide interchange protein n=1 Tax=Halomonas sp. EAR18 TaxID=2518972 RepID=UPI00109BFA2D|nr:DsbE family thiol:disulfide interchange protein [Halomonas sp. EAR18]
MNRRLVLLIPLGLFAALAVLFWSSLATAPDGRDSARLGEAFPAFELPALADPARSLDRSLLTGRVTLVNVWASWCAACRVEMPQLAALAARGVRLVGVNYKDGRAAANAFLGEFGDPFEATIHDPSGKLGFELGVYGAPETFLVDAQGVIRYHHVGALDTEEALQVILARVKQWRSQP